MSQTRNEVNHQLATACDTIFNIYGSLQVAKEKVKNDVLAAIELAEEKGVNINKSVCCEGKLLFTAEKDMNTGKWTVIFSKNDALKVINASNLPDKDLSQFTDDEKLGLLIEKPFIFESFTNKQSLPDGAFSLVFKEEGTNELIQFGGLNKIDLYADHLITLFNIKKHLTGGNSMHSMLNGLATGSGKTFVQALMMTVLKIAKVDGIFSLPDNLMNQYLSNIQEFLPDAIFKQLQVLPPGDAQNNTRVQQLGNSDNPHTIMIAPSAELIDSHYEALIDKENIFLSIDEQHLLMQRELRQLKIEELSKKMACKFLTATPDEATYELCGNEMVARMTNYEKAKKGYGQLPSVEYVKAKTSEDRTQEMIEEGMVLSTKDRMVLNLVNSIVPPRESPLQTIFEKFQNRTQQDYAVDSAPACDIAIIAVDDIKELKGSLNHAKITGVPLLIKIKGEKPEDDKYAIYGNPRGYSDLNGKEEWELKRIDRMDCFATFDFNNREVINRNDPRLNDPKFIRALRECHFPSSRWNRQPPPSRKMLVVVDDNDELINLNNYINHSDEYGCYFDIAKQAATPPLVYKDGNLIPRDNVFDFFYYGGVKNIDNKVSNMQRARRRIARQGYVFNIRSVNLLPKADMHEGIIYILSQGWSTINKYIEYAVIDPHGNRVTGKIRRQDLPASEIWNNYATPDQLNTNKEAILAELAKREHVQKPSEVPVEKCVSLKQQLKHNIFSGFVDYILCDITGFSVAELDMRRKYDLDNLVQMIKSKLISLISYHRSEPTNFGEKYSYNNLVTYYYNKLLYHPVNNKSGIDEEGARQVATLLKEILTDEPLELIPDSDLNVSDLQKRISRHGQGDKIGYSDKLLKAFVDNWTLVNPFRDQIFENMRESFEGYFNKHLTIYMMKDMEDAEVRVLNKPFSTFTENTISLKNPITMEKHKDAKKRELTVFESLNPNMKEHHYQPNYRDMTDSIADNYFRLGFIPLMVSNTHSKGFSDSGLHTLIATIPHAADKNNDPQEAVQYYGRLRGLNPEQNAQCYCATGKEVDPPFHLKLLSLIGEFFPAYFKGREKYNAEATGYLGQEIAEKIKKYIYENLSPNGEIDYDAYNENLRLIILKAYRKIYENNGHNVKLANKHLQKILQSANHKLKMMTKSLKMSQTTSSLFEGTVSGLTYIKSTIDSFFKTSGTLSQLALAKKEELAKNIETRNHEAILYANIIEKTSYPDLVQYNATFAELSDLLSKKLTSIRHQFEKSISKELKNDKQTNGLFSGQFKEILSLLVKYVVPKKRDYVYAQAMKFEDWPSLCLSNSDLIRSALEGNEIDPAGIVQLFQKIPSLRHYLSSRHQYNATVEIKKKVELFSKGIHDIQQKLNTPLLIKTVLSYFLIQNDPVKKEGFLYHLAPLLYPKDYVIVCELLKNNKAGDQLATYLIDNNINFSTQSLPSFLDILKKCFPDNPQVKNIKPLTDYWTEFEIELKEIITKEAIKNDDHQESKLPDWSKKLISGVNAFGTGYSLNKLCQEKLSALLLTFIAPQQRFEVMLQLRKYDKWPAFLVEHKNKIEEIMELLKTGNMHRVENEIFPLLRNITGLENLDKEKDGCNIQASLTYLESTETRLAKSSFSLILDELIGEFRKLLPLLEDLFSKNDWTLLTNTLNDDTNFKNLIVKLYDSINNGLNETILIEAINQTFGLNLSSMANKLNSFKNDSFAFLKQKFENMTDPVKNNIIKPEIISLIKLEPFKNTVLKTLGHLSKNNIQVYLTKLIPGEENGKIEKYSRDLFNLAKSLKEKNYKKLYADLFSDISTLDLDKLKKVMDGEAGAENQEKIYFYKIWDLIQQIQTDQIICHNYLTRQQKNQSPDNPNGRPKLLANCPDNAIVNVRTPIEVNMDFAMNVFGLHATMNSAVTNEPIKIEKNRHMVDVLEDASKYMISPLLDILENPDVKVYPSLFNEYGIDKKNKIESQAKQLGIQISLVSSMAAKDINKTSYKDIIAPMIAAVEAEANSEKYHNNKLFSWWVMETAALRSRWYQDHQVREMDRVIQLADLRDKDVLKNVSQLTSELARENKLFSGAAKKLKQVLYILSVHNTYSNVENVNLHIVPLIEAIKTQMLEKIVRNNGLNMQDRALAECIFYSESMKKINKILHANALQPLEKLIKIQMLAINYEKDNFHNIKRSCSYLFANENKNNERRTVADFCQSLANCDFSDIVSLAQFREKLNPPPQLPQGNLILGQ